MTETVISCVACAKATRTSDSTIERVLQGIRTGGKKLRAQSEQIRNRFEAELTNTGDLKAAKRAIHSLKMQLPGVIWTGQYSDRAEPVPEKLEQHSGLFIGDLDDLWATGGRGSKETRNESACLCGFSFPKGQWAQGGVSCCG